MCVLLSTYDSGRRPSPVGRGDRAAPSAISADGAWLAAGRLLDVIGRNGRCRPESDGSSGHEEGVPFCWALDKR